MINYGLELEETCSACAWESANGYVREIATNRMANHAHTPRYTVTLVWGRRRLELYSSKKLTAPRTFLDSRLVYVDRESHEAIAREIARGGL